MEKLRIAYLNSEDAGSLEWNSNAERDEKILKHEATEYYTLEDFADAFNREDITDLGYIVIIKHEAKEEQPDENRSCVKCGKTSSLLEEEDICYTCAKERGRV